MSEKAPTFAIPKVTKPAIINGACRSNMFNLILFGPPGSGKGTQSEKIINKYGLKHLSTGDLLRSEIAKETALGMEARNFMDKGQLVPDEVVIGMISTALDENPNAKGFLFDGFPRTSGQAEALDKLMDLKKQSVAVMLALDVSEEELVKRLLKRGETSGRSDDNNEYVIRARIVEYQNKTAAVADYYRHYGKVVMVKGEGSVDEIFKALCSEIDFRILAKMSFIEKEAFLKEGMFNMLDSIQENSKPVWGKMNVWQMAEHLADFFDVSAQKIHYDLAVPEELLPKYKAFLYSDKLFRENTKAPATVLGEEPMPLKSENFESAKKKLRMAVNAFFDHFSNDKSRTTLHPAFGLLNYDEWVMLHFKHVIHHLRQFNVSL